MPWQSGWRYFTWQLHTIIIKKAFKEWVSWFFEPSQRNEYRWLPTHTPFWPSPSAMSSTPTSFMAFSARVLENPLSSISFTNSSAFSLSSAGCGSGCWGWCWGLWRCRCSTESTRSMASCRASSRSWGLQSDFSRDSIGNTCLEQSQHVTCNLTSSVTASGTRVWNSHNTSHAIWLHQWQHREHVSGSQSQHYKQSDFSNDSIGNTCLEHSHNITCSLWKFILHWEYSLMFLFSFKWLCSVKHSHKKKKKYLF